jgi:Ca2+/Na+ antiporter
LVEIVSFLACTSFLAIQSRREIQAANEGERDIAADGVVGSNTFNALDCSGLPVWFQRKLTWLCHPSPSISTYG